MKNKNYIILLSILTIGLLLMIFGCAPSKTFYSQKPNEGTLFKATEYIITAKDQNPDTIVDFSTYYTNEKDFTKFLKSK